MPPSLHLRYFLVSILLGLVFGLVASLWMIGLVLIFNIFFKTSFIQKVLWCFLTASLYSFHFTERSNKPVPVYSQEAQRIIGKTLTYAEEKHNRYRQHLAITSINGKKLSQNTLLEYYQSPPIPPNHHVEFAGVIKKIPHVPDFDWSQYLSQFGIVSLTKCQKEIKVTSSPHHWWQKVGPTIRTITEKRLQNKLKSPHSIIALGMTIGSKVELPPKEAYTIKNAGLQHLIVVSGSNITLLLGFIALALRSLGPKALLSGMFVGLTIFWLTVGPEPPVNRAFIFGLCGSLSLIVGRQADSRNLLLLAGIIMATINPLLLSHSVSFWLSFLATFGIILLLPVIFMGLEKTKLPATVNGLISLTFSAQLSVLPIIIHQFGQFPSGGFVSNLIIEPVVPIIMILTSLVALFGNIPIIGEGLSFLLFWCINWLLIVAEIFSQWPQIHLPKLVIYAGYGALGSLILYGLFSKHYDRVFFFPFQAKLEILSKAKTIDSHDRTK